MINLIDNGLKFGEDVSRHRAAQRSNGITITVSTGAPVFPTSISRYSCRLSYRGFAQSRNRRHRTWPCHRPNSSPRFAARSRSPIATAAADWKRASNFRVDNTMTLTRMISGFRCSDLEHRRRG
jgi:hypothetical protein